MATLDTYQKHIRDLLTRYSNQLKADDDIETQLIFDLEEHHYQLLEIGWANDERIYNCILHIDIKNNKIWIQRNTTDSCIAEELISMGIPKTDIILGLQPPYKRPYTNYGVA